MGFIESLINLLKSLLVKTEKETQCELKTNKDTFYNYMVRGESTEKKDELWSTVVSNETNGVYDYKLTGNLGWYRIKDGQLIGNGTSGK